MTSSRCGKVEFNCTKFSWLCKVLWALLLHSWEQAVPRRQPDGFAPYRMLQPRFVIVRIMHRLIRWFFHWLVVKHDYNIVQERPNPATNFVSCSKRRWPYFRYTRLISKQVSPALPFTILMSLSFLFHLTGFVPLQESMNANTPSTGCCALRFIPRQGHLMLLLLLRGKYLAAKMVRFEFLDEQIKKKTTYSSNKLELSNDLLIFFLKFDVVWDFQF